MVFDAGRRLAGAIAASRSNGPAYGGGRSDILIYIMENNLCPSNGTPNIILLGVLA